MHPAFLKRGLYAFAPDDAAFQLSVGGGQFQRAPAQRLLQPVQIRFALPRGVMRLHNRREGLGEKKFRPLDLPIFAVAQFKAATALFVHPRQFQRLHAEDDRPASQFQRRLQACARARSQMRPQRRFIALGQAG